MALALPEAIPAKVQVASPDVSADGNAYIFGLKIKAKAKAGTYPLDFAGTDSTGRKRSTTVTLVIT